MKRRYLQYGFYIILIICVFALLISCGAGEDKGDNGGGEGAIPAAVSVTAVSYSINPEETTDVYATVYDASGGTISGVKVIFILDNPTLPSVPI